MVSNRLDAKSLLILVVAVIALFLLYDGFFNNSVNESRFSRLLPGSLLTTSSNLNLSMVATAQGVVSFDEINREVFIPQGYEIILQTGPIPTLKFRREPSCEQINQHWLKIAEASPTNGDPPKEVPFSLLPIYTMNNYSLFSEIYMNDKAVPTPREWTKIPAWMNEDPHNLMHTYGNTGMAVHHAFKFIGLSGSYGAVIGSQTPWVEVLALKSGAREVLTVEYQMTTINGTDKVKYIHPLSFARMWQDYHEKFDFVSSFSSIEHSGLQRYGDPMDPIGDIREVLKVRCALKKNGLFFLGLPRGQDHLVYNIHRIYGRIRLAMMFAGFELLHVFRNDDPKPAELGIQHFDRKTSVNAEQDLFVLRKIS